MNRLWIILGSIFTAVVLAFGSFSAVNALAHEDVVAHDVVTAAGIDEVIVRTDSGRVEVVGDPDATEIAIDAKIRHGLRRTEYSVNEQGGRLVVDSGCNNFVAFWCRVDVTISMPSDIPLDIRSSNGSLHVTDMDVGVVAKTSNGSVNLIGLAGNVDASTSNGSIRGHGLAGDTLAAKTSNGTVELTFSEPPQSVNARTSNGSVRIVVPDDPTAYDVDASTSGHSSSQVTVRTDPTSDNKIEAKTSNGSVSVFYPTS